MLEHTPGPVAHAATGVSILAGLSSLATMALPLISAAAGLVSIVVGGFAIAWYRRRLKDGSDL